MSKQVNYADVSSADEEDEEEVKRHEAERLGRLRNQLVVEDILEHRTVLRPREHRAHDGGVRGMHNSGLCQICEAQGLPSQGKRVPHGTGEDGEPPRGGEGGDGGGTTPALLRMTEYLVKWKQGSHLWDTWECNAVLRGTMYRGRELKVRRAHATHCFALHRTH